MNSVNNSIWELPLSKLWMDIQFLCEFKDWVKYNDMRRDINERLDQICYAIEDLL
jgi:hypothetical protein